MAWYSQIRWDVVAFLAIPVMILFLLLVREGLRGRIYNQVTSALARLSTEGALLSATPIPGDFTRFDYRFGKLAAPDISLSPALREDLERELSQITSEGFEISLEHGILSVKARREPSSYSGGAIGQLAWLTECLSEIVALSSRKTLERVIAEADRIKTFYRRIDDRSGGDA